ncbi:MAG: ShlB/FhaC/HecB family hemolysin secretion/activation protein [Planctomycetota bacterium]|jgi:hemolysin activation/secretion protein
MKDEAERAKREARRMDLEKAKAKLEETIADISLPADTTPRFTVKQLRISGNSLISADKIFEKMPLIYNASDKSLDQAESDSLYDFRVIHEIILEPGQPRQVSARTVQGLTQYVLSVYKKKNYAGIYVYVPSDAVRDGNKLRDDILPITVLEAQVTSVTVSTYDPNQIETEEGYLLKSAVEDWSPIKPGKVANQKELDDFVNLLNQNPDRYVSAVVTKGAEPESLAVNYDIYEANPWHWFVQVDNSGTHERQWNPRIGVINTNLLGVDDTFTAVYQAPWDKTVDENYSLFGSYDIPILGPRLRLNVYGGHSEFDISPETGGIFNFLGRGSFYGGMLRYNVLQADGWFLDVKGGVEYTRSKVTPSLFPDFLGTDIKFWLWGGGVDLHRSDDVSSTSFGFDRFESWGGESTADEFTLARLNAESDFAIYTGTANHSQYLDEDRISRLVGSFRWIASDGRLVPAKMTAFGGMYSVRGYDEYEYVADGGILASVQYEFDLVKYDEAQQKQIEAEEMPEVTEKPFLRKLAPLVFWDYGRSKNVEPTGNEMRHDEFMSIGGGAIIELGDNFRGAVYYGYPLMATEDTRTGDGRVNAYLLYQF